MFFDHRFCSDGRFRFDLSVARYAAVQGENPILLLVFASYSICAGNIVSKCDSCSPYCARRWFWTLHFSRSGFFAVASMSEQVPTTTDTIVRQPVDSEAVASTADTTAPGRFKFTVGPHVSTHGGIHMCSGYDTSW